MNLIAHLDALSEKHAALEHRIHEAHVHHQPVTDLKKQKLRIKDEMAKLMPLLNKEKSKAKAAA